MAENVWPNVQRVMGQGRMPADLRRLQLDVLSAVSCWALRACRDATPATRLNSKACTRFLRPVRWCWASACSCCGGVLAWSLFRGRRAPANPWGAATLEWQCASPPPHDNFAMTPSATYPYNYDDLVFDEDGGGYVHSRIAPRTTANPSAAPTLVESVVRACQRSVS